MFTGAIKAKNEKADHNFMRCVKSFHSCYLCKIFINLYGMNRACTTLITEREKILFHVDNNGRTFLHHAAIGGTDEVVHEIFVELPREMALDLSRVKDKAGRKAIDSEDMALSNGLINEAQSGCKKDYIGQAGSVFYKPYQLLKPPHVLIFYSTENRQSPEADAEAEKDCVESYFKKRRFPVRVVKDPTEDQIFSTILEAVGEGNLSGLVVFVMSHGKKGSVAVKGNPKFLAVREIMKQMCAGTDGKPKV